MNLAQLSPSLFTITITCSQVVSCDLVSSPLSNCTLIGDVDSYVDDDLGDSYVDHDNSYVDYDDGDTDVDDDEGESHY